MHTQNVQGSARKELFTHFSAIDVFDGVFAEEEVDVFLVLQRADEIGS